MEIIKQKIEKLRSYLRKNGLDAFIIPSTDPHFGEYVQEHYKCREWISNFDGSAATVVITLKEAALWTDSRYFVQASEQLQGTSIKLMKLKAPETPSISEWLTAVLEEGSAIGLNSMLFSKAEVNNYQKNLAPLELRLCTDPFAAIWSNRPALKNSAARVVSLELCGSTTESKLKDINNMLKVDQGYAYILSSCDSIAWLCNIRGNDIPFNPLLYSYLIFGTLGTHLFISPESIGQSVKEHLHSSNIEIHDYKDFAHFVANLDSNLVRIAPLDQISAKVYDLALERNSTFTPDTIVGGVVGALKAIKNHVEIAGFKKAMVTDAIAWIKFWIFIEENLSNSTIALTESLLAEKIAEFRSLSKDYYGESFSPIVAYGKNGAMPHYSPCALNPVNIERENFLLVDTGAHYPFGTTDTTRTFALGTLSKEQKQDYTMVLKGMINLSLAKFPKGTRGASLDILARGPIYSVGKMYMHGTGHGIGHNLCVHEGPQSVRIEENPVAIEPGMILSNEPAIYEQGRYGIRIENVLLCKRWKESSFGEFYCFETLTMIPIDKTGIDLSLLGAPELEWLNSYHKMVYEKLSPSLELKEQKWLAEKTSNICS